MADDGVQVRFGADISDLTAEMALAQERVKQTTRAFQDLTKAISQRSSSGVIAAEDLAKLRDAKAAVDSASGALSELNNVGQKVSAQFKEMSDTIANAAFEYGPWTGSHIQAVQGALTMLAGSFGTAATAAGLAAIAIVGAFTAIETTSAKFAETQGNLAATLGISTERVGAFRAVASAAGQDVTKFADAMGALKDNIQQDNEGTAAAFKALGISMDSLKGKDPSQILSSVASRANELGDSYNKTAALTKIFGDAAGELIPVLNQGAQHLQDLQAAADRAGVSMSGAMVQSFRGTSEIISQIGDNFRELIMSFQGLGLTIGAAIKPAVDGLLQGFSDLIRNFASAVEWINQCASSSGVLSGALAGVRIAFEWIVGILQSVTTGFQAVVVVVTGVAAAISDAFMGAGSTIWAVFQELFRAITTSFSALVSSAQETASQIAAAFSAMGNVIANAVTGNLSAAGAAFDDLKAHVSSAGSAMGSALSGINVNFDRARAVSRQWSTQQDQDIDTMVNGLRTLGTQWQSTISTMWNGGKQGQSRERTAQASAIPQDDGSADAEKAARDRLAAQQREIEGEIQLAKARLQQQQAIYNAEVQLKQIDEQEKIKLVMAATEAEYQTELGLLRREATLQGLKPAQVQAINNRIQQLQMQHQTQMLNLDVQSIQANQKEWQDHFDKLTSLFDGHIKGLITRSETLRSAFRSILLDMTMQLIQATEKMAVQWAVMEMAKTTATTSGAAARLTATQTADSASMASTMTTILKSITASASEAFAGIFGFLSPIMGPAAVGPALAGEATVMGAAASLPSFDVGAWSLPSDMVAQVHQGEMIVPAGPAAVFRQALSGGAAGAGSGVTVHHSTNFNVTAVDAKGVEQFFRNNTKTIMRTVNQGVRTGAHLGLNKLSQS